LTVVAAVLAFFVTFSGKIVDFANADTRARWLMIAVWGGSLAAFIVGGCAIWLIFNAGIVTMQRRFLLNHRDPSAIHRGRM
jgi:hypothetical protein